MYNPHDHEHSSDEESDISYNPIVKEKAKVEFAPKLTTETNRKKKMRDDFKRRYKFANLESNDGRLRKLKKNWIAEKNNYLEEIKPDDDRLVEQMIKQLRISSLNHADMLYLYEKYRELRQLQLRLRNLEIMKQFRILLGKKAAGHAIDLLEYIQHDAICMQYVDEDDYKISGITDREKNTILENLDLDPDNDEECDRWVSYIMFFSNPAVEWVRLRRRFEREYFHIIDSSLIQAMMNNDSESFNKFINFKIHKSVEGAYENRFRTLIRADRNFGSTKRQASIAGCEGGKLMLLMIRMRNNNMVKRCIEEGISVTSKCSTGQTKLLYWDSAKPKPSDGESKEEAGKDIDIVSSDDEDEEEDEIEKQRKASGKKYRKRKKTKIALQSVYEFETPLSTAVSIANTGAFDLLMKKANPLRCDNIAIRSCVTTLLENSQSSVVQGDRVYVLEELCIKTNQMLKNSALYRTKGRLPPYYFTICLLYQAIMEELWDAVNLVARTILDTRVNPKDKIVQAIKSNSIATSFSSEKLQKIRANSKLLPAEGSVVTKRTGGFGKMFGKRSTTEGKQRRGNSGGLQDLGLEKHLDMNEDLCFVLVSVIDLLIDQMLIPNANTHAHAIYGINRVLTEFRINLDHNRYLKLLSALVTVLENNKPGDEIEAVALVYNLQVLNFLGFDIDTTWDSRSIEVFLKHEQVAQLLQLRNKKKNSLVLPDKAFLLESLFVQSCRLNISRLLQKLLKCHVHPDDNIVKQSVELATIEGSHGSLAVIIEFFGKHFLEFAFSVAIEHSRIDSIKEIQLMDAKFKSDKFSLTESFLLRLLLRPDASIIDVKTKNRNQMVTLKTPFLLEFFFVYGEVSHRVVKKLILQALDSKQKINFDTALLFVSKAESTIEINESEFFADDELMTYILKAHDSQFTDETDKDQINWLRFVLEVFKIAGRNDQDVAEKFNDEVVTLLELKPEFNDIIDYADDEDEEAELHHSQLTDNSAGFL